MKRIALVALVILFSLDTPAPTRVIRGSRKTIPSAGGGGASAFVKVQSKETDGGSGSITAITMPGTIGASHLLCLFIIWEGSGSITGVTETTGGGAFTGLTAATSSPGSGNYKSQIWYRLSSGGGGTGITVALTGTTDFMRAEVTEFSYGGTCTLTASAQNANDSATTISAGNVSNSGTHRLNYAGAARFNPASFTSFQIAGVGADLEPDTWTLNCGSGFSTGNLTTQTATVVWTAAVEVNCNLACFAAN